MNSPAGVAAAAFHVIILALGGLRLAGHPIQVLLMEGTAQQLMNRPHTASVVSEASRRTGTVPAQPVARCASDYSQGLGCKV